jgi:ATP-dependent exoDNAse (exonuclease V) beta subunit
LHVPEAGAHRVVWWDPSILQLDARETMGLRQSKLLQADEQNERSDRGTREYAAWHQRRQEIVAAGARPALLVKSATELAIGGTLPAMPEAAQIEIERVARTSDRPRGKRFGTLVHAILAQIPLDAEATAIAAQASFFGRAFDAPSSEVSAAIDAVANALVSPLMRRAAAASIVRREAPLLLKLETVATSPEAADAPASTMVEGVADLAFVEDRDGAARWLVVDFKTDFDRDRRVAEYRAQLALYLRAITHATAMPADGYLLLI